MSEPRSVEKTYINCYRSCDFCDEWKPVDEVQPVALKKPGTGIRYYFCADCRKSYREDPAGFIETLKVFEDARKSTT